MILNKHTVTDDDPAVQPHSLRLHAFSHLPEIGIIQRQQGKPDFGKPIRVIRRLTF